MLRIRFLQRGCNLANLACEQALYDSPTLRRFVGIAMVLRHETALGVDSHSGLAHSAVVTRERRMYGDNAYQGQKAPIRAQAPQVKDFTNARVSRRKDEPADDVRPAKNRIRSTVQAKIEPVFPVVKRHVASRSCAIAGWSRMPTVPSRRWH